MMPINLHKSVEAILYVANRLKKSDIYAICKLFYVSDKMSLAKYGRLIFGDLYSAMKNGPVPSHVYDILKSTRNNAQDCFRIDGDTVVPFRDADLDMLSDSDIECLDYGINSSWKQRYKESHDKAWEDCWSKGGNSKSVPMPILVISDYIDKSGNLGEHLINGNSK